MPKRNDAFERFKKNYKPFFITKVPHEIAKTWIYELQFILKQIAKNMNKEWEERSYLQ